MSYFASSAAPMDVHWHDEKPTHLFEETRQEIYTVTRDALHELRGIIVNTEHTIEDICTHLGIHDFSHHLANKNLAGTTLTLYSNGHLEIRRE